MDKIKVIILGSNGFVGQNLMRIFKAEKSFDAFGTSRQSRPDLIQFDILERNTWNSVTEVVPDIIIDASGYGVVKNQFDIHTTYRINYLDKRELLDFVYERIPEVFWIQIGTAFEYSLEEEKLTENTPCFPKTHYGISKLLLSNYLTQHLKRQFIILRPLGMFGKGEDISKFFPLLIQAQKKRQVIDLSDGNQARDYFYIDDFAIFILRLILNNDLGRLESQIINVGSGQAKTLRDLSQIMAQSIPDYNPALWNWGAIAQRGGENHIFYNASSKGHDLGFTSTGLSEAFQNTINYYYHL